MKLFYCMDCQDLIKVTTTHVRSCECGNMRGLYTDKLNAVFTSVNTNYALLGYSNQTFKSALDKYFSTGSPDNWGINFSSFVIPEPCETFRRVSQKEFDEIAENCLH